MPRVDASASNDPTLEIASRTGRRKHTARPALVAIHAGSQPVLQIFPLHKCRLELGREATGALAPDPFASRRQAEVLLGPRGWSVRDMDSRNGTYVNGQRITAPVEVSREERLLVRAGQRIYLGVLDSSPYEEYGLRIQEGIVIGPALAAALERIRETAHGQDNLLILGESGVGKELAARTFHQASARPDGPLIAINCAAIPESVAERLLFGSTRGAYSGAVDAVGYIEAAQGGTLFLDEIGELAAAVQAKLLRVLENHEVLPLGSATPKPIQTRFCFATLRNLRTLVADQRFRPDLYFRIARSMTVIPPLRERLEEIPWLVAHALSETVPPMTPRISFVESCLLSDWNGNIRELVSRVRAAALAARRAGSDKVTVDDLPRPEPEETAAPAAEKTPPLITGDQLRDALATHGGNLAAAARSLGVTRPMCYRLLARYGLQRAAGNESIAPDKV